VKAVEAGRQVSDFRSDTVTKPGAGMLAAMMAAEVGDDVLDGDPTVGRLERRVADLLGKAGALFVPSGTMANQVALGSWTRPGDEIWVERSAHVAQWEAGAPGYLHGVQMQTFEAPDGRLDVGEMGKRLRPGSTHCPRTALVCVEQSFMGSGATIGGHVVPLEHLKSVRAFAREHSIPVHMDGARLMNAVVASGVAARDFAAEADSVSICLSKGLGCPVGSLVVGPRDFVERGRLVRKRLGGWMRQAGILAAAGLYALEHNVARLAEDHALARQLAVALGALPGLISDPRAVETNIVMVRVEHPRHDPVSLMRGLESKGVKVLPMDARTLRFVTHMDVGPPDVERAAAALRELLA
jgi:threonine aldolase